MAGCSSEAETGPIVGADEAFTAFAAPILDDARAEGASDAQIALIERAIAEGEVTPALALEAIDNAFACLADAGSEGTLNPVEPGVELPEISYYYSAPPGVSEDLLDSCLTENSMWVEMMYQVQPKAIAVIDAKFEENREYLIECLRGFGRVIDDDAPVDEIKHALVPTLDELDARGDTDAPLSLSCAHDVGIDGF